MEGIIEENFLRWVELDKIVFEASRSSGDSRDIVLRVYDASRNEEK